MPIDMQRALLFAKNREELYGKRDGGLSWTERARARIGRRKYESLMAVAAEQGVQGDEALNSAEAFAERELLKRTPVVKAVLRQWWDAVLATIRRARPDSSTLVFDECKWILRLHPTYALRAHTVPLTY